MTTDESIVYWEDELRGLMLKGWLSEIQDPAAKFRAMCNEARKLRETLSRMHMPGALVPFERKL